MQDGSEGRRRAQRDARDSSGRAPAAQGRLTGGIPPRHVKGQRADDPRTEPANSHPPGRVNDHEDGGPTIQLPAADARCTLRSLSAASSIRGRD